MPLIQVFGDPNTGGGLVETPPQTFFRANLRLVSIDNSPVSPHPPGGIHNAAKTANGSSFLRISGIRVNIVGNADTCGHTRIGNNCPWFNVQS